MQNNMGLIRDITRQREENKALKLAVQAEEARLQNQTNRARGPDPGVVARQAARAQELQGVVDQLAATLEASGIHMPAETPPTGFSSAGLPPAPEIAGHV